MTMTSSTRRINRHGSVDASRVITDHSTHELWAPVVHFAGHAVVGTALFLLIAAPAVGLHLLTGFLDAHHLTDGFTHGVLEALEKVLLALDATLFLVFLVVTAIRSIREM